MIKTLQIGYDPLTNYCLLTHPYSKRFIDYVRYNVSDNFRIWNPRKQAYKIHLLKLDEIIIAAKRYFDFIDWTSLPEHVQIRLALKVGKQRYGNRPTEKISEPPKASPYEMLYLMDSAPIEVVKAAYKALALLHHPDRGGQVERFQQIKEAYEAITTK